MQGMITTILLHLGRSSCSKARQSLNLHERMGVNLSLAGARFRLIRCRLVTSTMGAGYFLRDFVANSIVEWVYWKVFVGVQREAASL